MNLAPKVSLFAVVGMLSAPAAHAAVDQDKATQLVKGSISSALAVLKDPKYQGKQQRQARHAELRRITNDVFDWRAMSQRSLGIHWRKINEDQRKRFANTFQELLALTYLKQIDRFTGKEKIQYVGTTTSDEGAEVKMKIVTRSREEVPIHFFMGESLKVYDVSIEGVSIANNYRESFNRRLVNKDFETLMKSLEKKLANQKKRAKAKAAK